VRRDGLHGGRGLHAGKPARGRWRCRRPAAPALPQGLRPAGPAVRRGRLVGGAEHGQPAHGARRVRAPDPAAAAGDSAPMPSCRPPRTMPSRPARPRRATWPA
jgi:hypothetical protein